MAIETILVAVGRGDNEAARTEALASAIGDIATPTEAEVILLHVFSDTDFEDLTHQLDFDDPSDATPNDVARRHSATRRLSDLLEAERVGFEVRGDVGEDAGSTIVSVADDIGADLLIIGGRKRTPTGKAVFGSTAQQVMLNADIPVTYVRGQ
jgi:nucleotide-binding universal stress UspA family protein